VGTLVTNSFGRVIFLQVGLWTYSFAVSLSGYNQATGTIDASKVVDQTVVLTLLGEPVPPPIVEHVLTVQVNDAEGAPLPGITVQVAKLDGGYTFAGATGLNGRKVFTRAPTGRYGVIVNNGATDYVDLVADLLLTYTITAPTPGGWTVIIQALQEGGSTTGIFPIALYDNLSPHVYSEGTSSDENSTTVFTGVPTGNYTARITLSGVDYTKSFTVTGDTTQTIIVPQQGGYTVSWEGDIPPFKDGTYRWSLRFNIAPIPFLDNYIVDWLSQRPQDETALNNALASKGLTGTVAVTNKEITKHTNAFGNVDQFTITYTFTLTGTGLSLEGEQALVLWIPVLVAAIPLVLSLLTAVVYLLIVNSIVAGITTIAGPGGSNVPIIAAGVVIGIIYLNKDKK
jgi:hypothetical protein